MSDDPGCPGGSMGTLLPGLDSVLLPSLNAGTITIPFYFDVRRCKLAFADVFIWSVAEWPLEEKLFEQAALSVGGDREHQSHVYIPYLSSRACKHSVIQNKYRSGWRNVEMKMSRYQYHHGSCGTTSSLLASWETMCRPASSPCTAFPTPNMRPPSPSLPHRA